MQKNQFFYQSCQTPVGWMRAISDSAHLIQLDRNQIGWKDADRPDDVSRETITQLTAYFTGQLKAFTIPLRLAGVTRRANIDLMSWPASILGPPSAMPHLPPPGPAPQKRLGPLGQLLRRIRYPLFTLVTG